MGLRDREQKRNESFVNAIANDNVDTNNEEDKPKLKQMSYYLEKDQIKAITIKTADGELDKSAVVRAALDLYLADILETIRNKNI